MNDLARVLIVWNYVPCETTGAGIILRRLFQDYPADKLWLLTSSLRSRDTASHDPVPPPANQSGVVQAHFPHRFVDRLASLLNGLLVPYVAWRGARLARRKNAQILFSAPWSSFFVACYFIHKLTGLPLHVYMMDDPAGAQTLPAWKSLLYRLLMPRILRAASRVWCVSEPMMENLRERYGVDAKALLPLLDVQGFIDQSSGERQGKARRTQIVYTGAIYDAQLDALQNLVAALNMTPSESGRGDDILLTLYTSVSQVMLARMELAGRNVRRAHVPVNQIPRVLAEADILFLPFSFQPQMRHVIETSLPTKLAEYLASGVPILVHAPPCATVAQYCRKHDCGLVIDEKDPQKLLAAVRRLASDSELRAKLSARARAAAFENHDIRRNRPRFLESLVVQ